MSKKYLIIFLIFLILVLAGGSYYWKTKTKTQQKPVLPLPTNVITPTKSPQGANPYDKTNPFSNIKVNPFE